MVDSWVYHMNDVLDEQAALGQRARPTYLYEIMGKIKQCWLDLVGVVVLGQWWHETTAI